MHMPGHKRNPAFMPPGLPFDIDITEIWGFDDLHEPRGALRDAAEIAAQLYGSDRAFLLVNGSTVGILAAVGAMAARGDKILVAGNSHRSVDNAASLFGLQPVRAPSAIDEHSGVPFSVDPKAVKSALEHEPGIRLVVVTSPSYEGVVSDIGAIASVAHERNVPLLVDGAHGAHLGFSPEFPEGPVPAGADAVVMSLHKTLPALTQCSLLHVCSGRADAEEMKRLLSVLQTSSPSYVLLASIDHCLRLLASDGERLFSEYARSLERFMEQVRPLKRLRILGEPGTAPEREKGGKGAVAPCPAERGFYALDPGKLVIVTKGTGLSGIKLSDILRMAYKIELEQACDDYAIAMTSVCDSSDGFDRLAQALLWIDKRL